MTTPPTDASLQGRLAAVAELLRKHRLLEEMTRRQEGPKRDLLEQLQHRQNLAELHNRVRALHPADLASILDALTPQDRLVVWQQAGPQLAGQVLLEVSHTVREALIEQVGRAELLAAAASLDADDLSYLADALPADVLHEASRRLDAGERSWLNTAISYADDSVGQLMSADSSPSLGLVMMSAVLLNLLVAALVGIAVPLVLQRTGRDPTQGASVLLTFLTDGMGFFLFLALAHAFL